MFLASRTKFLKLAYGDPTKTLKEFAMMHSINYSNNETIFYAATALYICVIIIIICYLMPT